MGAVGAHADGAEHALYGEAEVSNQYEREWGEEGLAMFSMSMYGPVVRTLQDMASSLTTDSWERIQSATRAFPV